MATVATYNIHSCIGADGRIDTDRVAAVIGELNADIVALQEVDAQSHLDQWVALAELSGLNCIPGISLRTHRKSFGNALLTRLPVLRSALHDLSIPTREPRGAIEAEIQTDGRALRVIATHFGLRRAERRQQAAILETLLADGKSSAEGALILADLNEWRPDLKAIGFAAPFHSSPAPRTFPARRPLFALDRILSAGAAQLRQVRAHVSSKARIASDHLPLCAELVWAW